MSNLKKQGLARISLLLGFMSLFMMLGIFTALPAIITGLIARSRALNYPHQYSGSRVAMMGMLMGYLSIMVLIILLFMGHHLNNNGDLIPLLDTLDSTSTLSSYAKEVYSSFPFTRL